MVAGADGSAGDHTARQRRAWSSLRRRSSAIAGIGGCASHRQGHLQLRHGPRRKKHFDTFVELINLTNHSNVFGYNYVRVREAGGRIGVTREDEKWFTILPSLGVSWHTSF